MNKIKTLLFITILLFGISLTGFAQNKSMPSSDPKGGFPQENNPPDFKQQNNNEIKNPTVKKDSSDSKMQQNAEKKKDGPQQQFNHDDQKQEPIKKMPTKKKPVTPTSASGAIQILNTVPEDSIDAIDADYDFESGRWIGMKNGIVYKADSFNSVSNPDLLSNVSKRIKRYNFCTVDWKTNQLIFSTGDVVFQAKNFMSTSGTFRNISTPNVFAIFFGNTQYFGPVVLINDTFYYQLYFVDSNVKYQTLSKSKFEFPKQSATFSIQGIPSHPFLFTREKSDYILSSYTNNALIFYKNASDTAPRILNSGYNKISILNAIGDSAGNLLILANDSLNHGVLFKTHAGDTTAWEQVPVFRKNKLNIGEKGNNSRFIIIALAAVLFLILSYRFTYFKSIAELKKKAEEKEKESNPLVFAAEMPTSKDTLNIFGTTVDSVIELIKNPSTQPPLNIILSGKWGSGKSSLMAMIKQKLEEENKKSGDDQFVMLWFNVWHFQSAQHMLVVFLSSIMHLFEKTFKFKFRYNLFMNRLMHLRTPRAIQFFFTFFLLIPLLLYLLFQLKPFDLLADKIHIGFLGVVFQNIRIAIGQFDFTKLSFSKDLPLAIPVISWITGFILLGKQWQAWGLQSFFRVISLNRFQEEAKKEVPGFREKYKSEFWEIMQASEQKNYIIFIDDTDRITGDKIKEMLEGINFITDTASRPGDITLKNPRIYFIMAMDANEVAKNLGANLIESENSEDLRNAGARYLEKIVDIVIPVPLVLTSKDDDIISLTDRHR